MVWCHAGAGVPGRKMGDRAANVGSRHRRTDVKTLRALSRAISEHQGRVSPSERGSGPTRISGYRNSEHDRICRNPVRRL
jgi:hypothetical protein